VQPQFHRPFTEGGSAIPKFILHCQFQFRLGRFAAGNEVVAPTPSRNQQDMVTWGKSGGEGDAAVGIDGQDHGGHQASVYASLDPVASRHECVMSQPRPTNPGTADDLPSHKEVARETRRKTGGAIQALRQGTWGAAKRSISYSLLPGSMHPQKVARQDPLRRRSLPGKRAQFLSERLAEQLLVIEPGEAAQLVLG